MHVKVWKRSVRDTTPAIDELPSVDGMSSTGAGAALPRARANWNDRSVKGALLVALALAAFAGGRFSVDRGPSTFAEAMQQFRAGDLPAGAQSGPGGLGALGGPGAGAGGFRAGTGPGAGAPMTMPMGAGGPAGAGAPAPPPG